MGSEETAKEGGVVKEESRHSDRRPRVRARAAVPAGYCVLEM